MLLFYFPPDNATLFDYGTCFHTHAQWKGRSLEHGGLGDCFYKMRYEPNSVRRLSADPPCGSLRTPPLILQDAL